METARQEIAALFSRLTPENRERMRDFCRVALAAEEAAGKKPQEMRSGAGTQGLSATVAGTYPARRGGETMEAGTETTVSANPHGRGGTRRRRF